MGQKAISVEKRLCEFGDCGFVKSEGNLFCTLCCVNVEFLKKSTILNHLKSAGHVKKQKAQTVDNDAVKQEVPSSLQSTVDTTQKSISVERRLSQFPDCGFVNSDGILFCTWCCTDVNFYKRSTVVSHLKSSRHINSKATTNEHKPQVSFTQTSAETKRKTSSIIKRFPIINRLKSTSPAKQKATTNVQKLNVSSGLSVNKRQKTISIERRLREFSDCGFVNSEGILFCTWCCTEVDFYKRSTIVSHLKSIGHVNRKAVVFSVLDKKVLQDEIFFLKSCVFCTKDCSRCPKTIWDDDEKRKALKLVFSATSTGGFQSFFWQLLLGSAANKMMASSFGIEALKSSKIINGSETNISDQDATTVQILPVCTACLETVVTIMKLHSDLERIQMLLVDEIYKIQRNVKNTGLSSYAPDENKREEAQLEVLTRLRRTILTQSEKAQKIPLVFLQKFHGIQLPDCNTNNIPIKEEPVDEIQNPEMSPLYDGMDDWSPSNLRTNNIDDDESNEDNKIYSPGKKVRSRPFKKTKIRCVERSNKDTSKRKRSSRIEFKTTTQVDDSDVSESSSPQLNDTDILVKSKKPYRLIVRKNIWKRESTTGATDVERRRHFHSTYRCEICGKNYFMRKVFLKHKQAHKDEEELKRKTVLSQGAPSHELKKCCICQQEISQSNYYEHLLSHEEEVGKTFGSNYVPFACSHKDCLRKFNIEENFKIHMEVDHDEISSLACLLQVKKCDVCQMCYNTSIDLLEHFKKVHKEQSHLLYYCPVCAHSYSQSENLISHMHSHKNKDQQICFLCKTTSTNRNELLMHFEISHNLTTKGECEMCQKKFDDIYWYYFHLKDVHKRQDTFVCSFCGKICYFARSFMKHVKVHQKIEHSCEICNVCGREYSTRSLLLAHMKYHDERNFRCQICDKSFTTKGHLFHHKFVHINERLFTCELCGFACKSKYALKRHQTTHEKKFECNICGRKFSRMPSLNIHFRMHTGETLVCPFCGGEFHSQKSLRRHVKAYHESDSPLPMSRPHKKRNPRLRWKDSEGNVYYAKNTEQNESKCQFQGTVQDVSSTSRF